MIGWQFPLNNSGQEHGPQNSGVETFLNEPLKSLAKEICQNSCDARDDALNQPVEVHFDLERWEPADVPGLAELQHAISQCGGYWADNRKGRKLFDKAAAVAAGSMIRVLKISDYNTLGLTGSGDPSERGTNWHNLVKAVGTSDKSIGKLGSFGIGKHAPFACSDLRTVFYNTLDSDGSRKLQGVSILATHEHVSGETTQGTGYYGITEGNREVVDLADIPDRFVRERVGTDVYVIGFGDYEDWETQVLHSALDIFFKAIFDDVLIIKVGSRRVNSINLGDQISELDDADPHFLSPKYFRTITDDARHFYTEEDFEGFGRVELQLLPDRDLPKKVAMVRRSGMVVFDKGHFRTPIRFAGVLQIRGAKADAFFQELEPPAHDRWEPARYDDDPARAKRIVGKIYGWINQCVRELSSTLDVEEQDVPGLSQYLPDDTDEDNPPFDDANVIEEKTDEPLETSVVLTPKTKEASENDRSKTEETADGSTVSGEGSRDDPWEGEGDGEGTGDGTGTGTGGAGEGDGDTAGPSEEPGDIPIARRKPITLKTPRCFCTDPDAGMYEVLFTAPSDSASFLSLRSVGESDREQMQVLSAKDEKGADIAVDAKGTIGPFEVQADHRYRLEVMLPDQVRCALEITADED